jgi:DNA-binding LacI/PurR family transcriptional regulator
MTKPEKVASAIRRWISDGKYLPKERLPSILNMSHTLKASDKSVQKAVAQLAMEGIVRRENGVGVFVCSEREEQQKIMLIVSNPSFLETVGYFDYLKSEVYSGIKIELEKTNTGFDLYPLYELIDISNFIQRFDAGNYNGVIAIGELQDTMPGKIAGRIGGHRIVSANYGSPVSGRNEILINAKPGISKVLEKAYEIGHRKFAIIYADNMTEQRTQTERFTAFMEFCNKKDVFVPASCMLESGKNEMEGYRATNRILDKTPDTTLIFAVNDRRAEGVLLALKDRGMTPGKEVSVIGYDDMPRAKELDLATVKVPRFEVGHQAVRLLGKCLKGKLESQCEWLESEPVFRSSLGPALKNIGGKNE